MTTCGRATLWQDQIADILEALQTLVGTSSGGLQVDSYRQTSAGTISAGALSIAVVNTGAANATLNGQTLAPGYGVMYEHIAGSTYPAIAYDATATELMIEVVRPAA